MEKSGMKQQEATLAQYLPMMDVPSLPPIPSRMRSHEGDDVEKPAIGAASEVSELEEEIKREVESEDQTSGWLESNLLWHDRLFSNDGDEKNSLLPTRILEGMPAMKVPE